MQLKIGNLDIPRHLIRAVIFSTGPVPVNFELLATEEDGKRIGARLRELEKDRALSYYAQSMPNIDGVERELTGLCNILDLKVDVDSSKAPALYRISGRLQQVT